METPSFTLNILLFSLVTIISCSLSQSQFQKPPPTALHFPVRKNETTRQYYISFQMGDSETQSYKNTVIDLGGQYLWFICETYKSSLYRSSPCRTPFCESFIGGCVYCNKAVTPGCTEETCGVFAYNPVQNKVSLQELGKDTIHVYSTNGYSIGFEYDSPHFLFSCADSFMLEGLSSGIDGFVGLTGAKISLLSQLTSAFKLPKKFALCLPSTHKNGLGSIFIGGGPYFMPPYRKDLSKLLTKTPLIVNQVSTAPIYNEGDKSDEYFINVKSIKVDGNIVSVKPSLLAINKMGYGGTKISTTAPYTILHASIYKHLVKNFVKAASSKKMKRVTSIEPFGACFKSKAGALVPEIDLVLAGKNAVWKIYGANSMVEVKKNVHCLGFIDGGVESRTSIVLGGKQLENYLFEFDLASSTLGFSSSLSLYNTSCSQYRLV